MHCLIQRLEINYIYNFYTVVKEHKELLKEGIYISKVFGWKVNALLFLFTNPVQLQLALKIIYYKKEKVWKWNLSWEDSIPLLVSCLNVVSTWIFLGFNYKTCLLEVSKIAKSNFTFEWSKAVIKINLTARCCQPDKVTILSESFHFTQHCTLSSTLVRRLDWVPSQMRTKCTIL